MEQQRLNQLFDGWRAASFRRATGGLYALAGFDYQARFALAELATGLVQGGAALEARGKVFIEAISDVTRAGQHGLVCIQVKRTLTNSALKSAAAEVVAIHEHLLKASPEIARAVRFEVVAQQGDPIAWSSVIDSGAQESLRALLAEGRLLTPRIEPDPWWRLLSTIYRELSAPFEFARFALDRILSRQDLSGNATAVRNEICERFAALRTRSPLPGRVYQPADFDVSDEPRRPLAIGRLVTPERLREGQYMSRPERVGALLREARERLELQQAGAAERLEVMWLQGRSGSGKSVLLVQLLETLVRAGHRTVWLGGDVRGLDGLLRAVEADLPEMRPEFILIDDLFDPEARDDLDLQTLGRFIEERPNTAWPVLVTCGPPEFADAFRVEAKHRGFDVHLVEVAPVGAGEAGQLSVWYRKRSGREPQQGPAFAQAHHGQGLLVSMAVELAHADLAQFAQHFVDRLRVNDLVEALRVPLALARLYIWSPENWFDTPVRERLALLEAAGDVSLSVPREGYPYVRLTHPHIAAAIYDAVHGGANRVARANDLIQAFAKAIEIRNGSLLRRLLRAMANGGRGGLLGERLADVDQERILREWARRWREARDAGQLRWVPQSEEAADAAVSWARLAAKHPGLRAHLGYPPLPEALRLLEYATIRWPLMWESLVADSTDKELVLDWARTRIDHPILRKHPQWSWIWERCKPRPESETWLGAGQHWLQEASRPPDWHFVWRLLLEAPASAAWAREIGAQRLKVAGELPEWAFVWQDLIKDAELRGESISALLPSGWHWLAKHEERPEWTYVWRVLVEKHAQLPAELGMAEGKLLGAGWQWLEEHEERPEWTFLWRVLVEKHVQLPAELGVAEGKLLGAGWKWLEGHEERPEWTYVWRVLVEKHVQLPAELGVAEGKLLGAGWKWLEGHEERPEWTHVWQVLFEKYAQLPAELEVTEGKLLGAGWQWLKGREERPEWTHVWQVLTEKHAQLPAEFGVTGGKFLSVGWKWLAGREQRPEWPFIWQVLVKKHAQLSAELGVTEGNLLSVGWKWLEGREERPEWNYVWQILVEKHAQLPAELGVTEGNLLSVGWKWLEGREERPEWNYLWQILVEKHAQLPAELGVTEGNLLAAGWAWLGEREERPAWTRIWETLCYAARRRSGGLPSLSDVLAKGLSRLRHHDVDDNPILWSRLAGNASYLTREQRESVVEWGRNWLMNPNHRSHRSFGWVAEGILDLQAADDAVLTAIDPWLLKNKHPSGPVIAAKRIVARPEDANAARLAVRLRTGLHSPASSLADKVRRVLAPLRGRTLSPEVAALCEPGTGHPPKSKRIAVPPRPKRISPTGPMPEVGAQVSALVTNNGQPYGIFVTVDGWAGLIHRSVISKEGDLAARFPIGATVPVRVVGHKEKGLVLALDEDAPTLPDGNPSESR